MQTESRNRVSDDKKVRSVFAATKSNISAVFGIDLLLYTSRYLNLIDDHLEATPYE